MNDYKTVDMRERPAKTSFNAQAEQLRQQANELELKQARQDKEQKEYEAEQLRKQQEESQAAATHAANEAKEREYQNSLKLRYKSTFAGNLSSPINSISRDDTLYLLEPEQYENFHKLPSKLIAFNPFIEIRKRGKYYELISDHQLSPSVYIGNLITLSAFCASHNLKFIN